MVIFLLSMIISAVILLLSIVLIVQIVIYVEYSSRNMAENIRKLLPIDYEFYEDGLIETINGESKEILYGKLSFVKIENKHIILSGKKGTGIVIVIPRCLVDDNAVDQMRKLQRIIGSRGHRDESGRYLLGQLHGADIGSYGPQHEERDQR
jgi:hypothetical protein